MSKRKVGKSPVLGAPYSKDDPYAGIGAELERRDWMARYEDAASVLRKVGALIRCANEPDSLEDDLDRLYTLLDLAEAEVKKWTEADAK